MIKAWAWLGCFLGCVTGATASDIPLLETQGRACFGRFEVTAPRLDFQTREFRCVNRQISKVELETVPTDLGTALGPDSAVFYLSEISPACPFVIVEVISPAHPEWQPYHLYAYQTLQAFQNNRFRRDLSQAGVRVCTGYLASP